MESSLLPRAVHSHWVHADPPMDLSTEQDRPTSPKSSGQRFVEPCRFTDAQRTSLLITLKELGIGDDESRSLFLAALEYDLARCQSLLAVNPGSINAVTSPTS